MVVKTYSLYTKKDSPHFAVLGMTMNLPKDRYTAFPRGPGYGVQN